MFSVALSVGSRPPGVTWHLYPVEPGLSSAIRVGIAATTQSPPTTSLGAYAPGFNHFCHAPTPK